MKLSEAMELGSMMSKPSPGNWNTCALGVAGTAVGIPLDEKVMFVPEEGFKWNRVNKIYQEWPWLDGINNFGNIIAARFDSRVCQGKETFFDLVNYVRSIEPECGTCNEFLCRCKENKNGTVEDYRPEAAPCKS